MEPRVLRHFDRMAALTDDQSPFNIVIVLHISPRLQIDSARQILRSLQARHPFLRCRIAHGKQYRFIFDVERPIPVEEAIVDDLSNWPVYAEEQLNTRIDGENGPLMRCLALSAPSDDKSVLIFSFHHAILDGQSAVVFLGDFLQSLGTGIGMDLPGIEPIPPVSRMLPPGLTGIRGIPAKLGFLLRNAGTEIAYRLRSLRTPDLPLRTSARCRILSLTFSREETDGIVRTARETGITLNSLMNAALAVAGVQKLFPPGRRQVRLLTFADLRAYASPPIGPSGLGSAVSMIQVTEIMPEGAGVWGFAGQVQKSLLKAFRRGDKFFNYLASDKLVEMVIRMNRFRLGTCAMSYTGPLGLPERIGPLELLGVNAYISNNRFGPVLAGQARIFREQLAVDLLYLDTDMSREVAVAILDSVRSAVLRQV